MIFTSNFSNWYKIRPSIMPVNIARFPPRGVVFRSYLPFVPPIHLLGKFKNGIWDEQAYEEYFRLNVLARLNAHKAEKEIHNLLSGSFEDVVLLCYEAADKFCHRHIVREWFNENGICVKELEKPSRRNSLGLLRK